MVSRALILVARDNRVLPNLQVGAGTMAKGHVFVTGGAGFIGSHTVLVLLEAGFDVTVIDNLCNASPESLRRAERLSGKSLTFVQGDIRHAADLDKAFAKRPADAVIHFAGLKAVGESVEKPLAYYDNNVHGTQRLLEAMERHGCKKIVFSSSATVYGAPDTLPIKEDAPLRVANPYGRTKLVIEEMLRDVANADAKLRVVLLRYFNPVGAHPSGQIGEDPQGIPNNLMPYIMQVAVGRRESLAVFGNDYPTKDGTGVRDYIHVMDLARGHVAAIEKLSALPRIFAVNLGTGVGYSVLDVVKAASKAVGRNLPHHIMPRRPGDVASVYADPTLAREQLGWTAQLDLDAMCRDAWRWQQQNPQGFQA
jgi:UDP-glucose 4-epimerase